jgi:mannose-6-phosphate isomerase-like protein (cupin superfamily)
MKEEIRRFNPNSEFYTTELCHINELSNHADDPGVSIARARVQPGVTTRWHRLNGITERYVILEGEGLVEIGNLAPQELRNGDVVLIPPECPQRITNIGATELIFLAICSPRFRQDAYEDIEAIKVI